MSRKALKHKSNYICPNPNCSYTSRNWICESSFSESHKNSVSSKNCPIHQLPLLCVGGTVKVPKAGTKERIEMINKFGRLKN